MQESKLMLLHAAGTSDLIMWQPRLEEFLAMPKVRSDTGYAPSLGADPHPQLYVHAIGVSVLSNIKSQIPVKRTQVAA